MIARYIYECRALMETKRYSNKFLHKRRSVAEHMWSVGKLAEVLIRLERELFKNKVDGEEVLCRCSGHDVGEKDLGDIISTTKYKTSEMQAAVRRVEEIIYEENIESSIPVSWREDFRRYVLNPKDDTIEGKIVAAADMIDVLYECLEEINLGNKAAFVPIFERTKERVLEIDLESVKYFMDNFLEEFNKNE